MTAHTGKAGRINRNPNYSYRMVFLTNLITCLNCMILLAVYFNVVASTFGEYGLSWKFIFLSALPCPLFIGTVYGMYVMREIYLQFFGRREGSLK